VNAAGWPSGDDAGRLAVRVDGPANRGQPTLYALKIGRGWQLVGDLVTVEPMTGIEPAYSAWEADVLPLNYIGGVAPEG
jgi:hypothetical protein